MTFSRLFVGLAVFVMSLEIGQTAPGAAPKASDLVGVWELTSAKDLKSGAEWATDRNALWWFQFTRSHWTALQTLRERKAPVNGEAFEKLPPEEKMRVSYSRIWDATGQQVFAARGGTYHLEGNAIHHAATIAMYAEIIGVDRVLRIVSLDRDKLVVRTEFSDVPAVQNEWTFRRIE